jgi:hypothetical protein
MSRSRYQSNHLPKHFVLNGGNGTILKRIYEIETQNSSVDQRISFVKFCHAPPQLINKGYFIHIKRAGSPRLRHRRSFSSNFCSHDLLYREDKVCLGISWP